MAAPPRPSPPPPDWSAQAADTVVDLIDNVRSKTTGPLLTAAKAVVYGIIAAVLGIVALVLVSVALLRLVDVYLPNDVWLAYVVVGGVFVAVGLVLWSRRRPAGASS